jgi:hypothetical protein
MDEKIAKQVLEDVSGAVGLEEGTEGIRKILRFDSCTSGICST